MSLQGVAPKSLLMIPGPIEFDDQVLAALGESTLSHTSPIFIEEFGQCLERTRAVLGSTKESGSQPLILSGSGTLGWEVAAANFLERGKKQNVLVLNTGYFSDSVVDCCSIYVDDAKENIFQIKAKEIGTSIELGTIEKTVKELLTSNKSIDLVFLTQVDTSTAVLNPIQAMIKTIKMCIDEFNNNSNDKQYQHPLFIVDGVCSFGAENFNFDAFGVDFCFTASQKAFGCPPGLCICLISKNALNRFATRSSSPASYYCSLLNWLPIMKAYEARKPSYFATPNVNLIRALNKSLQQLLSNKLDLVFAKHAKLASLFRGVAADRFGLKSVADLSCAAHSLSAFYYPKQQGTTTMIDGSLFLSRLASKGVVVAGGLHKDIKQQYFRVGHMSLSLLREQQQQHLSKTLQVLEDALIELGCLGVGESGKEVPCVAKRGEAVAWFQQQVEAVEQELHQQQNDN